ncbi:hypothetical protein [Pseudomonas sp. BMS12]|uniref:hypothetical protein n=1 Tax=Pseudomonas sp. BMS12 TaxID=1796033 RepID=UPI000AFF665B|nr:hypothetical protein [Pseudomonas sp. BMS12]
MISRLSLITGLAASLVFGAEQQAQAADHGDVAAGVAVGAIIGGVLASQRPVQVYEPAPVVYQSPPVAYYPAPVYVQPRPVYVQPQPVYYRPAPVYYVAKPPRYRHGHKHHYRHYGRW